MRVAKAPTKPQDFPDMQYGLAVQNGSQNHTITLQMLYLGGKNSTSPELQVMSKFM